MKKRNWTGQQKLQIVLEGLSGKVGMTELCNRYEISQSLYCKWRDQLLQSGANVFDSNPDKKVLCLENKVRQLTGLVEHLTIELKKQRTS